MDYNNNKIETLQDVLNAVQKANLQPAQNRDIRSATRRVCEMVGSAPATLPANAPAIRAMMAKIRPAAHGVSHKTWANLLSRFRGALRFAGVIDLMGQGTAMRHPDWAPLIRAIADDKRLTCGLAAFANWCVIRNVSPREVNDTVVQRFFGWLETRTLCPKPRDVVRRVPHLWNEASDQIGIWPKIKLTNLSFKSPPKRLQWSDLSESLRQDAQAYLAMRAEPDLFDERPNAPRRPLAKSTLHQQREHLRLAASIVVESGVPAQNIRAMADLIEPERFKTVLRYYHERAKGQPNAFAVCLAKTMIQVAQYYVGAEPEHVDRLKFLAAKLPSVPFDLTAKNAALLRQFELEALLAKLLFLPDEIMKKVTTSLEAGRLDFVNAQVAIAIDFQLAIPLRPQNLSRLNWRRHFSEPDGPKGRLILHIPKDETKSGNNDFVAEVPDEVSRRLRWYRRHILSRLSADVTGDLFVTERGKMKDQKTLTIQIIKTIERSLGVHMTPHQFRHLCGILYLEENPEDIENSQSSARSFMDQDHADLCRLTEPACQPCLWQFRVRSTGEAEAQSDASVQRQIQEQEGIDLMRTLKHLPVDRWQAADREAFCVAFQTGDIFDETAGPGADLAEGTRKLIRTAYRRWLGFLGTYYSTDLSMPPADRITPDRVRALIEHLGTEIRQTSVANVIDNLCYAARLIAPERNWQWLAAVKARLIARAKPEDRFDRLVPPWLVLDFGIELMEAFTLTSVRKQQELQYRDGLILALISLWLIRRRSIEALTVSRHLVFDATGVNMLLYKEDTKAKRAESFRVPEELLPYLLHYLKEIRPRLLGRNNHEGLWASYRGRPLGDDRIYSIVRKRVFAKFGKYMGLHDMRRAGTTFLAMDAPELVGLIPGMLQHVSPDIGQRVYNLSRNVQASQRYAAHLAKTRKRLRPVLERGLSSCAR